MLSPDPAQQRVLGHGTGSLLVSGDPGTGKTAVLRERFARLIDDGADPERVALVLGSRRARDDARSVLLRRLRRPVASLNVVTVHGLANQVVGHRFDRLGYTQPPTLLSAADQFAKVRELLTDQPPSEWPAYAGLLHLRGFADAVRQFLTRAQESLLTSDDVQRRAAQRGLAGWAELATFYRRYLDVLGDLSAVDFAGLLWQASVAAEGGGMFDHVMVDDFQDSTLAAEALLLALAPSSLVVAGDLDAHVFSFQGTTDQPLRRFAERSAADRVELETSHRGPAVQRAAWSASHTSEEHAAVARELRRIHLEEAIPYGRLAVVIRRQGSRLGSLLRALDDAGVPRSAPDGGLSLLMDPATFPYVLALRWIARPSEREALAESLLTSDLVGISPAESRGLVRAAKADGGDASDALGRVEGLAPEAVARLDAVRAALTEAQLVADASVSEAFKVLWRGMPSSAALVARAEAGDAGADADLDAISALSAATASAGDASDSSTSAFLAALEAGEAGPGSAARGGTDEDAVLVLTAHGTVGREFDTVIVAGAVEGDFPSLARPEPMFDLAALDGPVSQGERTRRRLADERRLFRLVTSRARRRVLFTASDEHEGTEVGRARSRFVGGAWSQAPAGPFPDPLTVSEAGASWRRDLADPAVPAPERLGAIEGLLALGDTPQDWWYQREWTGTGRPFRDHVRVSASRMETLVNCDLQFVLREELGLDTSTSYYAWVGHTVHRIIQDCEQGALDRSLEALIGAAHERWRPEAFPSMAVSETFRRLVVTRMLPQWFAEYAGEPALRAEERFEFELDGATVAGVIDRIGPARPEGSQITDYKTGKNRGGDPSDNLQLAIYYLAVHEAENLREFLPVRGIELAFVRDVDRFEGGISRQAMGFTSSEEPEYEAAWRDELADLVGRVRTIYDTGVVRPNPDANCRYCTFQTLCPLFPDSRDPFPHGAPA